MKMNCLLEFSGHRRLRHSSYDVYDSNILNMKPSTQLSPTIYDLFFTHPISYMIEQTRILSTKLGVFVMHRGLVTPCGAYHLGQHWFR